MTFQMTGSTQLPRQCNADFNALAKFHQSIAYERTGFPFWQREALSANDWFISDLFEVGSGRRVRRWRSISEKLKIVHQAFQPGVAFAQVARAHGVNANQVFTCRRASERGGLREPCEGDPVTILNRKGECRDSEAVARLVVERCRSSFRVEP
jgi:transposase